MKGIGKVGGRRTLSQRRLWTNDRSQVLGGGQPMTSEGRTGLGTQAQRILEGAIKAKITCFPFLHRTISNSGIHFDPASVFMIKHRKLPPECAVCVKYEELIQHCQT